jgi:hypothetical protein
LNYPLRVRTSVAKATIVEEQRAAFATLLVASLFALNL